MAEVAPAAASPVKVASKAAKKKSSSKLKSDGPSLPKLILGAVADSKDRKGTSVSAIKKYVASKGIDVSKANKRINNTLTRLVAKGDLVQVKGVGASGSFKLAKKETKAVKPKGTPKKAPVKARKPALKKTTPKAKAVMKKVAVKAPKKGSKKAVAKRTSRKIAPKKTSKKTTPKKAAKRPTAKKAPAMKVVAKAKK